MNMLSLLTLATLGDVTQIENDHIYVVLLKVAKDW